MADLSLAPGNSAGAAPSRVETRAVAASLAFLIVGAIWLGIAFGWRQGALYLVGGGLGFALSAFALWGSKLWALTGADVASWGYWSSAARAGALQGSVFADITSVMDFGIILGALLAAGLAGRFSLGWRVAPRSLAAAALGGFLLGYGARLAYGCNIGAYFSGVASSSLHGWVWLAMALLGTAAGVKLRPWFGLAVERSGNSEA